MTTRLAVVQLALKDNGYNDGAGYGAASKYSADMHHGAEYDCADGVSWWFRHAGLPLPVMQPGDRDGFSYCPDAWTYARQHGATCWSWQAQPADFALFDWTGDGVADHVELVESWSAGVLHTIGADSGPSNVDHYRGQGGTHRHTWSAPSGAGNKLILGIVNTAKLVHFATK